MPAATGGHGAGEQISHGTRIVAPKPAPGLWLSKTLRDSPGIEVIGSSGEMLGVMTPRERSLSVARKD
jgi:hypothetical protein